MHQAPFLSRLSSPSQTLWHLLQGGGASPVTTVEPRRRKFHRPITVTLPLPGLGGHWHTVILSYCHTVILLNCLIVTPYHLHTFILSHCLIVLRSHHCNIGTLVHCHTLTIQHCHISHFDNVTLYHRHNVTLSLNPPLPPPDPRAPSSPQSNSPSDMALVVSISPSSYI